MSFTASQLVTDQIVTPLINGVSAAADNTVQGLGNVFSWSGGTTYTTADEEATGYVTCVPGTNGNGFEVPILGDVENRHFELSWTQVFLFGYPSTTLYTGRRQVLRVTVQERTTPSQTGAATIEAYYLVTDAVTGTGEPFSGSGAVTSTVSGGYAVLRVGGDEWSPDSPGCQVFLSLRWLDGVLRAKVVATTRGVEASGAAVISGELRAFSRRVVEI